MKFNPAAAAPLRNSTRALITLGVLHCVICIPRLHAQVGDNNPTGVSGIFNGQAGACGYDPYTGNATRSITDISVAGAVGDYPLALVRTANSRTPSTTDVFSYAGGWTHNYNWIMEDSPPRNGSNLPPIQYTVDFPDGRVETFKSVTWDPGYYRVLLTTGGSAGVRERVAPIAPPGNMYAFLILPDGGKVKFLATQNTLNGQYFYKYQAVAIIDPHGLQTTLTWESFGNGKKRLTKVADPSGPNSRYLQFSYANPNNQHISQVQEFINGTGRRFVQYNYPAGYLWLGSVVYYGNASWTARYQYAGANVGQDMPPLLWTCDDPMYPGPMKRIAYEYKTGTNPDTNAAVYGQILRERYWDGIAGHETMGQAVSELTVGTGNPVNHNVRIETRGDGKTRTFTYTTDGYLTSCTDFMTPSHTAYQGYDGYKYINYVKDRKGNRTDFTIDNITGNVLQVKFPLTPEDTTGQGSTQPTINYTYTNNYYLNAIQGENTKTITILRDPTNRVTEIGYPDGGQETFPSYNSFNQVKTHVMVTGGTETYTYDNRGLRQEYRNPDNSTGNPTARYLYDQYDRVSDITDVLGTTAGDDHHTTSFSYNLRGQLTITTLPVDPVGSARHTVKNYYNDDGTVWALENQFYKSTQYNYDDYRRLKSVTPPDRNDGTGPHTTYFYYDANGSADDYRYTDSNVTFVKLPSGKQTKTLYDDNRRRQSVTVGYNTVDASTSIYGYDDADNVTSVTNPYDHENVNTVYDKRNRPYSISVGAQTTTVGYDAAGHKITIIRPNGQLTTNVSFDEMNRVLEQDATQTPNPTAATKYTYYAGSGLLNTIKDPHLVALNNGEQYRYVYDGMGRRSWVFYPHDSGGVQSTEYFTYDTSGRLATYKNRNGNTQTFGYDALNRMTGFTWDDGGLTPGVTFGYDAASRLTSANNVNANIARAYYNDNLLHSETESILSGGYSKTVTYTYDGDGNRGSTQYPEPSYLFGYSYNGRNQLAAVSGWATYQYDLRGNLTNRTVLPNGTSTDYQSYDTYDRVQWVVHHFANGDRSFNYGYDGDRSNDRLYSSQYPVNAGDVFGYDLNDQVIACWLDILDPAHTPPGDQSIFYDGAGNRTTFEPYDWIEGYTTNNLNQYTHREVSGRDSARPTPTPRPRPTPPPHPTPPAEQAAAYDNNGNMITGFDGYTYIYDGQNRLVSATTNGVAMTFAYDALNRQVRRTVTTTMSPNGDTTFSVWNGWNLIEEYKAANGGATTAVYLYGATGLIADVQIQNPGFNYYYQDGSGSTSHLADANGNLVEGYRYDLQGTPSFYDAGDIQLSGSAFGVRHLFTGQQWYREVGLYDLRNRFYSPDIGRFLQPDPIGFNGDSTNLYRYCGNNPVALSDPTGEYAVPNPGGWYSYRVNPGWGQYVWAKTYVPGTKGWCAWGAQVLAGGYVNGTYYNMPNTGYWFQGASLTTATLPNTVVARGWVDGGYPQMSPSDYVNMYGPPVYHTGIFLGFDNHRNALILDQWAGKKDGLGVTPVPPEDQWQWNEVDVDKKDGPYGPGTSGGRGGTDGGLTPYLASQYNPYYGYLPTSPTTNFAGGIAMPGGWHSPAGGPNFGVYTPTGVQIPGSIFGPGNFYSGLDPNLAFGHIYEGNPVGSGEGGWMPKDLR